MSSGYRGASVSERGEGSVIAAVGREFAAPRFQDRAFLVVAILLSAGIWMFAPHEDPEAGSLIQQTALGVMYLAGIIGVIADRKISGRVARGSWPVLFMVALAMLSTLWSDEAYTTARRSFELFGSGALALYLALRLGLKAFLESFALAMTIAAAISAFLIAFVPEYGLMQELYAGAWRGLFAHKNTLGLAMVLGMMTISLIVGSSHGIRRLRWIAAFILMSVLLVGCQAITAVLAALILLLICPLLFLSRHVRSAKPAMLILVALSALAAGALLTGIGPDDILGLAGRDSTLTGRTELWQILVAAINERPILGWGYQAFFISHTLGGWDPGHAHNGILEAALDLGIVGMLLVIVIFCVGCLRTWVAFWGQRDLISAWPLFVMIFTISTNFSEDCFSTSDYRWLVLVAAFVFGTDAWQRRARKAPSDAPVVMPQYREWRARTLQ